MVGYSLIDSSKYKLTNDSENNIYIKSYQKLIFFTSKFVEYVLLTISKIDSILLFIKKYIKYEY